MALQRLRSLSPRVTAAALAAAMVCLAGDALRAQSLFTQKPADPGAVVVTAEEFGVKGDGVADDTDALQQAMNRGARGIVLIPEGRYRLTKTLYVTAGTRVFGYGEKRPVFVVAADTPFYQEPGRGGPFGRGRYMVHFANSQRPDGTIVDASELDFNSALANIDFEIAEGNPYAVGVRFKVAQHSYLSYIDFKLGTALAAMEDIGNCSFNLNITGGQYGIISTRTSPNWQYVLMDTVFENQSVAGVNTKDVGFSLERCTFRHMPVAIEVPEDESDQIYGRDLRFEDISEAGVKFGDARHMKHQVTLVNTACTDVPQFLGNALETIPAPAKHYMVDRLSAGLHIGPDGREIGLVTEHKEHALDAPAPVVKSDIPTLPPMSEWHTVASDDDLQAAINEHRVLYFPMGRYQADAPLQLKPDTVLIGLHCTRTTVSAIVAPKGGTNLVSGLAFSANADSPNILWLAGEESAMDDIAFSGGGGGGFGGGFGGFGGGRGGGARGGARGAGAPQREAQPYLVVKDGGGGVIRNMWVEGGAPPTGMQVLDTTTPGKIYQLSNEHHRQVEVIFRNVENWYINCLQTEEEDRQPEAYVAQIENCKNVTFANTYMYRVSRTIYPVAHAIRVRDSENIVFDNVHIFAQARLPFDNAVIVEGSGVEIRANNFAHAVVSSSTKKGEPLPLPPVFASGAKLQELASGFSNATSLTADDQGVVYFTDAANAKIYRWNAAAKEAEVLAETSGAPHPQVMGFVEPSTLLVAAFAQGARQVGGVYSVDTKTGDLRDVPETEQMKPGTALLLPVGIHNRMDIMQDYIQHRGYEFRQNSNTSIIRIIEDEHRGYFYAPDSSVALMAGGTGRPIMQASQMKVVKPGEEFLITSEDDVRTWRATLEPDYQVSTRQLSNRGGNAVVADADGNIYLADGHVTVLDKEGKVLGTLETPHRASGLAIGGPDGRTLFIGARGSLYSIPLVAGRE